MFFCCQCSRLFLATFCPPDISGEETGGILQRPRLGALQKYLVKPPFFQDHVCDVAADAGPEDA